MGWFDGLMSGFQHRHYALEAQQLRDAELRNEREARIFDRLLSSPDDEIKSLAAAGLISSAQNPKRKGGFRGWLGEMETNPLVGQIQALIGTKKATTIPGIPSTQMSGGMLPATPASAHAAALPAGSPTEAGSAAMQRPEPWVNPGPWTGGYGRTDPYGEVPPESLRRPADTDPVLAQLPAAVGTPPQPPAVVDAFMGPREAVPEAPASAEAAATGTTGDVVPPDVGTPPEEPVISGAVENPTVTWEHPEVGVTAAAPEPVATLPGVAPELATRPPVPESVFTTRTTTGPPRIEYTPRQVFQTPEGQMRLNTLAREEAEYQAEYNYYKRIGFSDAEIKSMLQEKARRTAGGGRGAAIRYQRVKGSLADGTPAFGTYDPSTGQFLDPNHNNQPFAPGAFQPADDDSFGVLFNRARDEFPWGRNARLTAEQTRLVNDRVAEMLEQEAYGRGTGTGRAAVERGLDKNQEATWANKFSDDWLKVTDEARGIDGAVAKMEAGMDAVQRGDLGPGAEDVIVTFQKVLDKNSVVREAEAERPGRFTSLLKRIQGYRDNLIKGGAPNIPAESLQQYLDLAYDIQKAYHELAIEHRTRIGMNARYFQIPEALVFGSSSLGLPADAPPLTEPPARSTRGTINSTAPGYYVDKDGNLVER